MEKVAKMQEKKVKEQLAAAVEYLQWSYAIFWSSSTTHPKVLSWCDGYYNGDIKTRKITNQLPTEFEEEEVPGLHRNEQLKELYESLSTENNDDSQKVRRPSTSLSPEDLTSTEWYYLVCMSFTFGQGEGLPGRALESNQYAWVSGVQFLDKKTFSRSILAKSASIQTVVCIPVLDGVLELGTTKFVLEDPNLVQQIMEMFWERPHPVCSEHSSSNSWIEEKDEEENMDNIFNDALQNPLTSDKKDFNDDNMSPFSFDFPFRPDENSEQMQEMGTASSMSSSFNGSFKVSTPNDYIQSENLENLMDKDRYKKTLSAILENSEGSNSSSAFPIGSRASSFTTWRRNLSVNNKVGGVSQKMLKKILKYTSSYTEEYGHRNKVSKQEQDDVGTNHVLSERRRREKLNEKFLVLRSLLPTVCKMDKASILGYAIEYLKELEKRVTELESCKNTVEVQARENQNKTERTFDNFRNNLNKNANKRKACDMVESEGAHINVNVIEKEVMIELKCTWRESLLLDIVNVIDELELETRSVLSSNMNGILSLTVKAKCRNSAIVSPGTVKIALCRITGKH